MACTYGSAAPKAGATPPETEITSPSRHVHRRAEAAVARARYGLQGRETVMTIPEPPLLPGG